MTTLNDMRQAKIPDLRFEIEAEADSYGAPMVHILLGPFNFYIDRPVDEEGDSVVQMQFGLHMNTNGIRHGEQTKYLLGLAEWLRDNPAKQPVKATASRSRSRSRSDGSPADAPPVE